MNGARPNRQSLGSLLAEAPLCPHTIPGRRWACRRLVVSRARCGISDALLECFVRYSGLYLVGSGASLPFVPLAGSLDALALSAFLRGGSLSTEAADQDDRTREFSGHL